MERHNKTIAIGLLGTNLDGPTGPERWEKWRPTVALCQHDDLLIDRLELLYQAKFEPLVEVIASDLRSVSPETQVRRNHIAFADPWDFQEVYGALHDWARAYPFDTEREDYLVHLTTGTHVAQICLFLLAESRRLPARLIQTAPPTRYNSHTPGRYETIDLDLSKYDRLASRFQSEQREAVSFLKSGIATRNTAFNKLIERIEQVGGASREPLLLMGPTGAGKSHLAQRIYELKKARHQVSGAFVEVNCATLRGDTAMSTLFGHVKGAFTGAMRDRPGMLKAADGGVLFLDEIGELGLDEQAMLLRALEEKIFWPLGGDKEVRSDFQLIAGTNCDLAEAVETRRFREDLLARINLWTFSLPALRERLEDLEPNLDYELEKFAVRMVQQVTFNKEAREKFLRFATAPDAAWRGNFRDLNGAVIRLGTLAAGGRISVELVDEEIARLRANWQPRRAAQITDILPQVLSEEQLATIDLFDCVQLEGVLRVCRAEPNISAAGRKLFGVSRTRKQVANDADRLRKYLARFDLSWESGRENAT